MRGGGERDERTELVLGKWMEMRRSRVASNNARLERVIYGAQSAIVAGNTNIFLAGPVPRYKNILCRRGSRYDADAPAYKHYAYRNSRTGATLWIRDLTFAAGELQVRIHLSLPWRRSGVNVNVVDRLR